MATRTENFELYKPDATDNFSDFREEFNDNMDIIDENLGGGGGSGGHTIIDENGQSMTQRTGLEFTGNVQVTDDSENDKTIVEIVGGGSDGGVNVYGAFLNPARVIYSAFTFDENPHDWVATEDCILTDNLIPPNQSTASFVRIDGKQVFATYSAVEDPFIYVKKGQTVTYRAKSGSIMKAYAIQQGTNGIFAPVIYSDNERVIGVWRDNKPLYQRILTLTQDTALVADTWVKTEFNKDTMETLVRVDASIGTSGAVVEALSGGFIDGKLALNSARNIGLNVSDNARIIVQYTKTTVVAGSGNWNTDGVPTHHYSTNETVIGTWISGKPLYEKTINFGSIPNSSTKEVDHNISNLGMVVGFEGMMMNTDGVTFETLPSGENSNFRIQINATKIKIITSASWVAWTNSYITLKYTKTTD